MSDPPGRVDAEHAHVARVWRTSWGLRVGALVGYPLFVSIAVFAVVEFATDPWVLATLLAGSAVGILWSGSALASRLQIASGRFVVVNPFVTWTFPAGVVARVAARERSMIRSGSGGTGKFLELDLVHGTVVRCVAVQTHPFALASGRPSRADLVAQELREQLSSLPSAPLTEKIRRRWTVPPLHAWVVATLTVISGLAVALRH